MFVAPSSSDGGRLGYAGHTSGRPLLDQYADQPKPSGGEKEDKHEQLAFPTENAIRQKAQKAAGHVAQPRRKVVEQHHDDCGEDMTPLGIESQFAHATDNDLVLHDECPNNFVDFGACFRSCFHGSGTEQPAEVWAERGVHHIAELVALSSQGGGSYVDVCELFGGGATTTHVLVRRFGRRAGINFEIMCGVDLPKKQDVDYLFTYLERNDPEVVLMAPPCTGYCKWGNLNRQINPEAWKKSQMRSRSLGRLSGRVAISQLRRGKAFMVEQPAGSGLYDEPEWKQLEDHVFKVVFEQCMTGLRMAKEPFLPVRKSTEIRASHEQLLFHLQNLRCDGKHEHAVIGQWKGHAAHVLKSADMQVWPLELCERIAAGIHEYLLSRPNHTNAFAAGTHRYECPGCRGHLRQDDKRHSRSGDCRFKHVEPSDWRCPACRANRHRAHRTHTLGPDCQWAVGREMPAGGTRERRGSHPRDGRVPACRDPTSTLSDDPRRESGVPGDPAAKPKPLTIRREPAGEVADYPADPEARRALKAADSGPRTRKADAGTQAEERSEKKLVKPGGGPPAPDDGGDGDDGGSDPEEPRGPEWSRFDLVAALQALRSVREGVVRRALWRLHLRWYHCSAAKMRALLSASRNLT